MSVRVAIASLALPCLLLGACNDREYIGDDSFFMFAVTEETPAFGEEIFFVELEVELPIRPLTDEQRRLLRMGARDLDIPYGRLPWVERDDLGIEVDYTLSNLEEEPVSVLFGLNGRNEFHEYVPRLREEESDFNQWERAFLLEPLERRSGTIREEELDEVAVDLATVVNGAPNPNQVVFRDNQSARDERNRMYIPEVVPGLVGLRFGLRTGEAVNLVAEMTIRVRDAGNRLTSQDAAWRLPNPDPFDPGSVVVEE